MFPKKFEMSNAVATKDRVSAVLGLIFVCGFLHSMMNGDSNYYISALEGVALIADIIWIYYFLPKRPNAAMLSKCEFKASVIFVLLICTVLIVQYIFPEIIPEWKNIALGCVLFAGLAYFALSTPTPRGTW